MSNFKLPLEEIEKRIAESKAKRLISKAREEAEKEIDYERWKKKYGFNKREESRMSNFLTTPKTQIRIIFAAYDEKIKVGVPTAIEGVLYFPDETKLRLATLENKNMVNLNSLIKKNCHKCNGTGRLGAEIIGEIRSKEGLISNKKKLIFCDCLNKNFTKAVKKIAREQKFHLQ